MNTLVLDLLLMTSGAFVCAGLSGWLLASHSERKQNRGAFFAASWFILTCGGLWMVYERAEWWFYPPQNPNKPLEVADAPREFNSDILIFVLTGSLVFVLVSVGVALMCYHMKKLQQQERRALGS